MNTKSPIMLQIGKGQTKRFWEGVHLFETACQEKWHVGTKKKRKKKENQTNFISSKKEKKNVFLNPETISQSTYFAT